MQCCVVFLSVCAIINGCIILTFGFWTLVSLDALVVSLPMIDKSLGLGVSVEKMAIINEIRGNLQIACGLTIALGSVVIFSAIVGIIAVASLSRSWAILYVVLLACLLPTHVFVTGYLLVQRLTSESAIRNSLRLGQTKYFVARNSHFNKSGKLHVAYTQFFEHMHIAFNCCGVTRPSDIRHSGSYVRSLRLDPNHYETTPPSCCKISNRAEALEGGTPKLVDETCRTTFNSSSMHKEACLPPMINLANKLAFPGLVFSGSSAVLLGLALGFMSVHVCQRLDEDALDHY